ATGDFPIVITANNGIAPNATQNFTLHLQSPPTITSANTVTFVAGVVGTDFTVTTTGAPTPALTETGALPCGVTVTNNNNGTATLAGTPTAGTQAGSPYALTVGANNGIAPAASQPFTLNITCPAINVSGSIPANLPYNVAITPTTFTQTG